MSSGTEGFNLYERLAQSASGRRILGMFDDMARQRDGTARQAQWECEDGWIVAYTTTRIVGGPHHGSFAAQLFKPGKNDVYVQDERRLCATRREAKERAIKCTPRTLPSGRRATPTRKRRSRHD